MPLCKLSTNARNLLPKNAIAPQAGRNARSSVPIAVSRSVIGRMRPPPAAHVDVDAILPPLIRIRRQRWMIAITRTRRCYSSLPIPRNSCAIARVCRAQSPLRHNNNRRRALSEHHISAYRLIVSIDDTRNEPPKSNEVPEYGAGDEAKHAPSEATDSIECTGGHAGLTPQRRRRRAAIRPSSILAHQRSTAIERRCETMCVGNSLHASSSQKAKTERITTRRLKPCARASKSQCGKAGTLDELSTKRALSKEHRHPIRKSITAQAVHAYANLGRDDPRCLRMRAAHHLL